MRWLFVVFATLTVFSALSAQTDTFQRHEISASYGSLSVRQFADVFSEHIGSVCDDSPCTPSNESYLGTINLGYNYRLTKIVGVGVVCSYERSTDRVTDQNSATIGRYKNNYITILPMVKFSWINERVFKLYSKIGLGTQIEFHKETLYNQTLSTSKSSFAIQTSFLGIELGRSVCGFIELGIGHQGVEQFGVKYKF